MNRGIPPNKLGYNGVRSWNKLYRKWMVKSYVDSASRSAVREYSVSLGNPNPVEQYTGLAWMRVTQDYGKYVLHENGKEFRNIEVAKKYLRENGGGSIWLFTEEDYLSSRDMAIFRKEEMQKRLVPTEEIRGDDWKTLQQNDGFLWVYPNPKNGESLAIGFLGQELTYKSVHDMTYEAAMFHKENPELTLNNYIYFLFEERGRQTYAEPNARWNIEGVVVELENLAPELMKQYRIVFDN